jgi:hypothetical protein
LAARSKSRRRRARFVPFPVGGGDLDCAPMKNTLLAGLLAVLCACASVQGGSEVVREGAPVSSGPAVAAAEVLRSPELYEGKTVVVEGRIAEVCKVKGCWMVLGDRERWMRVTFKDYGFFVPKDCEGAVARVEGVFTVERVSVAQARHYLEDAGRHEEAAKVVEAVETPTLVANGVELRCER